MDNSHDTLIGALNRAAEWFSESCMKAEATYCLSAIEAAKGKRHMDKPVSEPTAPAEPSPTLEQNDEDFVSCGKQIVSPVLAQLSKDAARYRWLRENWLARSIYDVDYGGFHQLKPYEQLDAAIDAAIASTPPNSDPWSPLSRRHLQAWRT